MEKHRLDLDSIDVAFADSTVLKGLSLSLLPGEVKFLVGPNGCGKTTLFNVIAGTVKPVAGRIRISGADVSNLPPQARARSGVIRSFQIPRLSADLTAADHILAAERRLESIWLSGLVKKDTKAQTSASLRILEEFGFDKSVNLPVSEMSHGQRKLLDVACVFAANPLIVLLDEPAAGIDEEHKQLLAQAIARRASTLTMVLIEHDMDFVERFAFPIAFLSEGRILHEGSLSDIKALPEAARVYF